MSIKVESLFKMSYKELKEKPEQPQTSICFAYLEVLNNLLMLGMVCGTLLLSTQMWVTERHDEVVYLRGSTP